jgi:hypothetical protein
MESSTEGVVGKFFKMVKTVSKKGAKRRGESMTEQNKRLKKEIAVLKNQINECKAGDWKQKATELEKERDEWKNKYDELHAMRQHEHA